ncbi:hypothetical protein ACUNHG_14210 [Serratia sp. IR-2025]
MTITTEKLNEIYENPEQCSYSEIQEMAAMLANREAQPVGFRYRNKDTVSWLYNDWRWPDSVEAEQCQIEWLYTAPPAPAVPPEIPLTSPVAAEYVAGWNACRAAMLNPLPDGEKCWSCGEYFTYAQHSECDGYCPHCNAPVDLEDDEGQPSQVVPVEPTEEMVAKAWRETLGKCDHETIKRMYATMLAAAPEGGNEK